ncbi:hypothetical protein NDU88_006932 [Pleurodeles waltl]|uniref:Uncharacterized protein n=1 Tax=Pleurodeles waltl TaxID=8319 RepID=A0AAV7PNT9_PLEWA|nr:hypothetical protein NDU88_006932 [Pleurodeles waltl]
MASASKINGKDPVLSQLLRLVLEKLGREEAGEVLGSPFRDVGGDRSIRPKRSHVAPSAAFPPVKRKRNGKTPAPASSTQTPNAVASPPVHIDLPEPPALVAAPSPMTQGVAVNTYAPPVPGLEGVLADIRKSLASFAPTSQSGTPPAPLPVVALPAAVPAALPVTPPTPKAPEHQAQVQDPSRQTLLEPVELHSVCVYPLVELYSMYVYQLAKLRSVCDYQLVELYSVCDYQLVELYSVCVYQLVDLHSVCVYQQVELYSVCVYHLVDLHSVWVYQQVELYSVCVYQLAKLRSVCVYQLVVLYSVCISWWICIQCVFISR